MNGIFNMWRSSAPAKGAAEVADSQDSVFFSTAFSDGTDHSATVAPWEARAVEVGAKRLPSGHSSSKLLQELCAKNKYMAQLPPELTARMGAFFDFAQVPSDREIVRQDEYGNFMFFLLSGTMAVNRVQPWGEKLLLAQTRPGDMIGEMSLLDSGIRFSACTTMTDCEIAVLSAHALDEMMVKDPQLAAALVAVLARKLCLRLRAVSAHLGENQK
ncbi:Crp/Fnr family transcriptional regulator [Giesbergeria anulus]|uniref:Cyclic nucleotide-binding domain-containing protein n=1 Tax=Giesbergeria anulus TaxID=180197 RepID=A0A1H9K6R3_9BURK|nr:Cyclic nucleotide-binding domain-containing protein [Giesbergeria anulus]